MIKIPKFKKFTKEIQELVDIVMIKTELPKNILQYKQFFEKFPTEVANIVGLYISNISNKINNYIFEQSLCEYNDKKIFKLIKENLYALDFKSLFEDMAKYRSYKHMEFIKCVINTIFSTGNINTFANWFQNNKIISYDTVEGEILQVNFNPFLTVDLTNDLFVVKIVSTKNISEAIIAMAGLNNLRQYIPTFMYVFGYTTGPDIVIREEKIYNFENNISGYIVTENIDKSIKLSEFIFYEECNVENFISILIQVVNALNLAYITYKFKHGDLHGGNILVSVYTDYLYIPLYDKNLDSIGFLKTKCVANIIDYGLSEIEINGYLCKNYFYFYEVDLLTEDFSYLISLFKELPEEYNLEEIKKCITNDNAETLNNILNNEKLKKLFEIVSNNPHKNVDKDFFPDKYIKVPIIDSAYHYLKLLTNIEKSKVDKETKNNIISNIKFDIIEYINKSMTNVFKNLKDNSKIARKLTKHKISKYFIIDDFIAKEHKEYAQLAENVIICKNKLTQCKKYFLDCKDVLEIKEQKYEPFDDIYFQAMVIVEEDKGILRYVITNLSKYVLEMKKAAIFMSSIVEKNAEIELKKNYKFLNDVSKLLTI